MVGNILIKNQNNIRKNFEFPVELAIKWIGIAFLVGVRGKCL